MPYSLPHLALQLPRQRSILGLISFSSSIGNRRGSCGPSSHSTFSAPMRWTKQNAVLTALPDMSLLQRTHCRCTFSGSKRRA